MVTIQQLSEHRWPEYRALRLEALKQDPIAFGSSFEEEAQFSQDEWKRRLQNAVFAVDGDVPVGLIVRVRKKQKNTQHILHIFSVYVKVSHRTQGIGKKLLDYVIAEAKRDQTLKKLQLMVNPLQKDAVRLYEQAGFTIVGTLRAEMQVNGVFYDELMMEKLL
jgi:ribosomal protein S18 acetylase RimI-like enzyme